MSEFKNYQTYRWFYTSSGNLVLGGKSAEQNEKLLQTILQKKEVFLICHTTSPGSPFSIAISQPEKLTKKELYEIAVFTASFSRAWREAKKEAQVDFFLSTSLYKNKKMPVGTWGVKEVLARITVPLLLTIKKQKNVLRAIPPEKDSSLIITPGNIPKEEFVKKLEQYFPNSQQALISALPSGKFKILKSKK